MATGTSRGAWRSPEVGVHSITTDGAFKNGMGGAGIIIRYCSDMVVCTAAFPLPMACSAIHAEALAIVRGVEILLQLKLGPVWIEAD